MGAIHKVVTSHGYHFTSKIKLFGDYWVYYPTTVCSISRGGIGLHFKLIIILIFGVHLFNSHVTFIFSSCNYSHTISKIIRHPIRCETKECSKIKVWKYSSNCTIDFIVIFFIVKMTKLIFGIDRCYAT